MANNNDKEQTVKTQQSNVTVEGDAQKKVEVKTGGSAPQQSAVPAAGVVAQKSTVPVAGSGSQECAVSAEQSSDSTNNTRRRGYIVISSIFLVLSILCVAASIYLYFHQMHAMILNPKTIYCIVGAGALALCCGVLSLWKLIAECKKGKDSPAISAVASSATATVNTVESAASVESAREAEIDRRITKLTENIQKQSLDIARTQEITSILERRLITVLSEYKIAEKGDTLADTLQKLGVGDDVTSSVRSEEVENAQDSSLPAAPAGKLEVGDVVVSSDAKSTRAA